MKTLTAVVFACLLLRAYAIEGLVISVPTTNVVLSWPSDQSESYLIQYRHTLDAADTWTTLADYYPPDYTTNITCFYDTNIDWGYAPAGGSGGGSIMMSSFVRSGNSVDRSEPLMLDKFIAMLMPPALTQSIGGAPQAFSRISSDSPQPQESGGEGGDTSLSISGTGFYRVVRDGVHLVGITNDTVLSGMINIPVELGNAYGDVISLNLSEDESPIGNSIQTPVTNPNTITLDTTAMANGVHQIYGSATWQDTNGGMWQADSPVISVTVSNEISFENWMPTFGELDNTLLIRATSAHPDTDWNIDIYDSRNHYVGSFSGHTTDGDITVVWNLFDADGIQHTNDNFFTCKVSTPYADPPKPTYKVADPWLGTGAWAAACQHAWDDSLDFESLYTEINGLAGFGQSHGGIYPSRSSDGSPYALTFGSDNPQGDADWSNFRQALTNPHVRNLIYFGHGGQNGLGYNPANTNRFISAENIGTMLHNIPAGQTNHHGFRFVFIDACSTAKGTLPEAFGILHRENVPGSDYINSSTRFSTYVGWSEDKMIGLLAGRYPNYDHISFIHDIQLELLLYGNGIKQAIVNASRYPNTYGSFGANDMKVFGYWDMTIGAFNN